MGTNFMRLEMLDGRNYYLSYFYCPKYWVIMFSSATFVPTGLIIYTIDCPGSNYDQNMPIYTNCQNTVQLAALIPGRFAFYGVF